MMSDYKVHTDDHGDIIPCSACGYEGPTVEFTESLPVCLAAPHDPPTHLCEFCYTTSAYPLLCYRNNTDKAWMARLVAEAVHHIERKIKEAQSATAQGEFDRK